MSNVLEGLASARLSLKFALAAIMAMAITFGSIAYAPPASASSTRGGVNVALYCAEMVSTFSLTYNKGKWGSYKAIAKNDTGKWDGWYCDRRWGTGMKSLDRVPVDMNFACSMIYGKDAAWATNYTDKSGPRAWAVRIGDKSTDWRCAN